MKKLILLSILLLSVCYGTIINVPSDSTTIQAGINGAEEGDTVLVAAGTYVENIIWPEVNGIKLIGSGMEDCIIDGDSLDSVIKIQSNNIDTSSVISGFTITNGNSPLDGGGIEIGSVGITIKLVKVIKNVSDRLGGGISCSGCRLDLIDSIIKNNISEDGGGFSASGFLGQEINIQNVLFEGNLAYDKGGGIYHSIAPINGMNLSNVIIKNNMAFGFGGGGINNWSGIINFSSENRSSIFNNMGIGADIFSLGPMEVILDTFTVINPTNYHALSVMGNFTFDINNSIITDQKDTDLYVSPIGNNNNDGLSEDAPLKTIQYALSSVLVDSLNHHNIYIDSGLYSPSSNGEFFPVSVVDYVSLIGKSKENVILDAENTAGVMRIYGVENTIISNFTLTNGNAHIRGGGIHCQESNPILSNLIIKDNYAEQGGGMNFIDSSPLLVNVIITGNSAKFFGGISTGWSDVIINRTTIIGNSSIINSNNDYAGGIGINFNSNLILLNSIVWDNYPIEVSFSGIGDNIPAIFIVTNSDLKGGEQNIGVENIDNYEIDWLEGNINVNPLFTDPENADFSLQTDSPCIDAGTNLFVWETDTIINMSADDYCGTAPDMGAYEYCLGCQDETACNYDATATESGDCIHTDGICETCLDGVIVDNDADDDTVCDDMDVCEGYDDTVDSDSDGTPDGCDLSIYEGIIPDNYSISSIYPNPFNPVTKLTYGLPENTEIQITVYDMGGTHITSLVNSFQTAGYHTIYWNASSYPSGVYLIRMDSGDFTQTQKVVLVK